MSHFTLLVVGDKRGVDYDTDLARFSESDEEYQEFVPEIYAKDLSKALKAWKVKNVEGAKKEIEEYNTQQKWAEKHYECRDIAFDVINQEWRIKGGFTTAKAWRELDVKQSIPECVVVQKYEEWYEEELAIASGKAVRYGYKNAEEWADKYHGYSYNEEEKAYGYYNNPDAQWDWHTLGGRWLGYFKLKKGKKGVMGDGGSGDNKPRFDVDKCRKGDIDVKGMIKGLSEQAKGWWDAAHTKSLDKSGQYFSYGIEEDDTEKTYIDRRSRISTFALLQDDVWHEQGSMGWFGSSSCEETRALWDKVGEARKSGDTKLEDKLRREALAADRIVEAKWHKRWMEMFDAIPDDTWVAVMDCHI